MKRKIDNDSEDTGQSAEKRPTLDDSSVHRRFRSDLFSSETIADHAAQYAQSEPYKHAVVSSLLNDALLRTVRAEILDNIHFTAKETDIYKIHQSGDLANLDGLPTSALGKLPSLLKLRDALYSQDFREWISSVSGAGPLSGQKTDMAVNVYVPGCHLLCHDDVIGSRRVSYILYLTDPDHPWKPEWGGALRLYPVNKVLRDDGQPLNIPKSDWVKSIPPSWNQLSFFAVQPGESFHDVEEVYARSTGSDEDDGGRFRIAISGWFHIPQAGEDGYRPGLEEQMVETSSLQQLQGSTDEHDRPRHRWLASPTLNSGTEADGDDDELSQDDLQFLLQFMTPNYLTPDTVEELNDIFTDESILQLTDFLSPKFAATLKNFLSEDGLHDFSTSTPPYKHRYRYLQASNTALDEDGAAVDPVKRVLNDFLPSAAFQKWLSLATGLTPTSLSVLARHFRKGLDYQLAQGYHGNDPQLEYTLCVTPSKGWFVDDDSHDESGKGRKTGQALGEEAEDNSGGYELYMAGDDTNDDNSENEVVFPSTSSSTNTGAGQRRSALQKKKSDPAVYQAATDNDDDGILFSNPAAWNTLSIVLRDQGTLKFVKYVSNSAPGDRFDFTGCVGVDFPDDSSEDE